MSKLAKDTAIVSLPVASAEDHTAKRGYVVKVSSGSVLLPAAATDIPLGVIVDGGAYAAASATPDSIAVCGGGAGIVKIKCAASAGTIVVGSYLVLDGTTLGAVKVDPASGNRVRVARALEAGANDALIDAVLIDPVSLS